MTKRNKVIESEIQPNHKEAEVWIKPAKEDGTREVSYWNRKTDSWDECGGG